MFNYICTFGLTEGKNPSVVHKRIQDSVNSSSIYRHRTQPMRNYSHALYIYFWLIEKSMRTESPFPF
jgi:hypothetical protein